jgi:pectinesterase inhibitor-like protein
MKGTSTFVSFLILSCFFLQLTQSFTQMNVEVDDLVDDICKKTPNVALCSTILHSNPQASKSDTKGIAFIMVNDILANTTNTLNYIQVLVNQTEDLQLQRKFAICAETYIPLVKYVLPQAIDNMNKNKYGLASYSMVYIGKEIDSCKKQFAGSTSSPLGDRTSTLHKLLDIASAILKQLLSG